MITFNIFGADLKAQRIITFPIIIVVARHSHSAGAHRAKVRNAADTRAAKRESSTGEGG